MDVIDGDFTLDPDFAPTPAEAVVFDLGNVLIRWIPRDAVEPVVGAAAADQFLAHDEFDFHEWNHRNDTGRALPEALAEVRQRHPELAATAQAYVDNFAGSLSVIEESVSVLKELAEQEIPLYAITNWSADLFPKAVELFDFLDLFEEIIVSGEEGVAKPDPEIWEILAEATDHIGGLDEFVFIDDTLQNVQSAVEAGLDGIQFTSAQDLRNDLVVRGLLADRA
ncbi:HAD-IA family hydrolase [Calidifontibacter terrae]